MCSNLHKKLLHSSETALLNVHTDITLNMDKGNAIALTLLYLSAAFDTISLTILVDHLSLTYGVCGVA